jgi:hypothetical protein
VERPDWHMRPPFLVAFVALAIAASFVVWWGGLLMIGVLAAMYVYAKLGGP